MNDRVATCLLLSRVLTADGMVSPDERALLERAMGRLKLSEGEQQSVRDLEGLDLAEAVVAALPVAQKRAIMDELVEAALVDGKLSPHETKAIATISAALGIA